MSESSATIGEAAEDEFLIATGGAEFQGVAPCLFGGGEVPRSELEFANHGGSGWVSGGDLERWNAGKKG